MRRMLPVLVLAFSLSPGWWGALVHATATALGLQAPAAIERPSTPTPPTTQGGCSWDPWGCTGG